MRRALWILLFVLVAACNFDAAFDRYCKDNPNCRGDASGASLDGAQDSGSGGGTGAVTPASCKSQADCGPDKGCYMPAGVCVPTSKCQFSGDRSPGGCPPGSRCALLDPRNRAGDTFCACSPASCGVDRCHVLDLICEPRCHRDSECQDFDPPRYCSEQSVSCVPYCRSDQNCPREEGPFCNPEGKCVECLSSADCENSSDGRTECTASGTCDFPQLVTGS